MQIYWGAVPYVGIQCVMIGLVIAFPQMVMVYKDDRKLGDPSKVNIDIPLMYQNAPPVFGTQGGGAPAAPAPQGAPPGGAPAAPATEGAPPGGDPLRDLLNQQEGDADKANKAIEDALKAK